MIDRAKQLLADLNRWLERHRATRVTRRAVLDFLNHGALQSAGSMAYFAILSIFQLLVLAVVVLSLFLGEGGAREFVLNQVELGTPIDPATAGAVIDAVIESRGGISVFGSVLLIWSALGAFSALNRGVASAFVAAQPRPFLRDKLIGLLLMGVVGILAVASIVIGVVTGIVQQTAADALAQVPGASLALGFIGLTVPMLLIFFAFLAIYRIVPNRPVGLKEVWPGALVATLLWSALRVGFTYYATHIARYDTAFGPISTGISLLVFLYFASVVVLLGAEFARASVLEAEALRTRIPQVATLDEGIGPDESVGSQAPETPEKARRLPAWAMLVGSAVAGVIVRRIAGRRDHR